MSAVLPIALGVGLPEDLVERARVRSLRKVSLVYETYVYY